MSLHVARNSYLYHFIFIVSWPNLHRVRDFILFINKMDSAKKFLDLPNEIIEVILQDRDITHIDLCRISQTCTDMQNLCMSNELWRRKLHQRYSVLYYRFLFSGLPNVIVGCVRLNITLIFEKFIWIRQHWLQNSTYGFLSRDTSLSCHTFCDTGPRFLPSHPKNN